MKCEIWDPFEEMKKFRKEMEKTMNEFWSREKLFPKMKIREPLADIIDKKNKIEITAELPGVDKKDIKINVGENKVEIKAERKMEKEEKKKNFYRQERSYSGFYKAFALPAKVNPMKAKTSFSNGILKITLPKTKQLPTKSRILHLK